MFCRIASGALKAPLVLEDERFLAFLDHKPLFKGHTLLVPKQHFETLTDVPRELLEPLFLHAQKLSAAMREALGAEGSFVAMNNRVSQSVPHLHVHVVPRTKGDGLKGFFWPRSKYDSDEEAEEYAGRLRATLTS